MDAWILPGLCLLIAVLTTLGFYIVNAFRDHSIREENRKLRATIEALASSAAKNVS